MVVCIRGGRGLQDSSPLDDFDFVSEQMPRDLLLGPDPRAQVRPDLKSRRPRELGGGQRLGPVTVSSSER